MRLLGHDCPLEDLDLSVSEFFVFLDVDTRDHDDWLDEVGRSSAFEDVWYVWVVSIGARRRIRPYLYSSTNWKAFPTTEVI